MAAKQNRETAQNTIQTSPQSLRGLGQAEAALGDVGKGVAQAPEASFYSTRAVGSLDELTALPLGSYLFADVRFPLTSIVRTNYRGLKEDHVEELVESIKETGLRKRVQLFAYRGEKGELVVECVDGHHRLEAISRLRTAAETSGETWHDRPLLCEIRVAASKDERASRANMLDAVIGNNFSRQDESEIDRARAYGKLRAAGLSVAEIARKVNENRRSVERHLAIADLPDEVLAEASALPKAPKQAHLLAASRWWKDRVGTDLTAGVSEFLLRLVQGDAAALEKAGVTSGQGEAAKRTAAPVISTEDLLTLKARLRDEAGIKGDKAEKVCAIVLSLVQSGGVR